MVEVFSCGDSCGDGINLAVNQKGRKQRGERGRAVLVFYFVIVMLLTCLGTTDAHEPLGLHIEYFM